MTSKRKVDRRFFQTVKGLGAPIKITVEPMRPDAREHGYYVAGRIAIGEHVPDALKPSILVHELLHMVDEQMQGLKITKRPIPHAWIINASPLILAFLVQAGFWKDGPTLAEMNKAMLTEMKKDKRLRLKKKRRTPHPPTEERKP